MDKNISPKAAFDKLFAILNLEKKDITNLYIFAVVSGLISLSLPLGIQAIITYLFAGEVSSFVVILIFFILFGVLVSGFLTYLTMLITERIRQKLFTRYSLQIAERMPKIDLHHADKYYLPELTNRFFDVASLQKSLTKVLLELPGASLQILFGLLLLSVYHQIFIVFNAFIIAILIFYFRQTFNRGFETSMQESNYKYELAHWMEDIATNIRTVKLGTSPDYVIQKTDNLLLKFLTVRKEHFKILVKQFGGLVFFKLMTIATLLLAGTFLFLNQEINLGQLVASEIIIVTLINSVEKLFSLFETLYQLLTSFEKVHKLTDLKAERQGNLVLEGQNLPASLSLQEVAFNFADTEESGLKNLKVEIKAGERICIIGAEGSGKSSLLKVLSGAYQLKSGKLLFNQIPYNNYDLSSLRQRFGVLLSDTEIFNATIIENILLGDKSISTDVLVKECDEIGLLPYIQKQPLGFETVLESGGNQLPRGARVKLLLLRVMLHNPSLFLAEDYWGGLPIADQNKICEYMFSETHKFTMIIATHDISFAKKCDKIILMDEGRIVDIGSFENIQQSAVFKRTYAQTK